MKTLLALALFISVGACGQTTKLGRVRITGLSPNAVVYVYDGTIPRIIYSADENKCDGNIPISNPFVVGSRGIAEFCYEQSFVRKPSPVDVPAIQEPSDHFVQWCDPEPSKWCHQEPDGPPKWSCKDKSRTLMETLDGKTHYCHKPSFGP